MNRDGGTRTARSGFTLIEAVFSTLIVAVVLVGALQSLAAAARAGQRVELRSRAALLAETLASEIAARQYEDPDQTPVFGLEAGETGASRAGFDDVDDYNNLSESPPYDRAGAKLDASSDWSWSASVQLVDPTAYMAATAPSGTPSTKLGALTALPASGLTRPGGSADSGLKRIIVSVRHDGAELARLTFLKSAGIEISR